MNSLIPVGNWSFPRKREARTPRLQRLPPVHARGKLWTPAFAGVTNNTFTFHPLFWTGLLGSFLLGFGVVIGAADERRVLYYRDPMGQPYYSADPKKDAAPKDYIPVYERGAHTPLSAAAPAAGPKGKILYQPNPMGLPKPSPGPTKDTDGTGY